MDWWAGCGLWTGTAVTENGWPGESPHLPCLWASGVVLGVGPARGGCPWGLGASVSSRVGAVRVF